MELYHAGISSCSQKVRMVLAVKGLAFDSRPLNLQAGDQFTPEYLALNPNAVVPTLVDGAGPLIESTLINEYLDDAYPEPPLKPTSATERHRMRLWCKRFDALHASCGVVTYAIGVRPGLLQRPASEVDALVNSIPDAERREVRRSVVADGVASPHVAAAVTAHARLFADLNAHLTHHDWLAGDAFSLADAGLTPYVLRVSHLQIEQLLAPNPALRRWFERVQATPQYVQGVAEWLPQPAVDGFAAGGAAVADQVAALC